MSLHRLECSADLFRKSRKLQVLSDSAIIADRDEGTHLEKLDSEASVVCLGSGKQGVEGLK